MPYRKTRNVSLTPELEAFVDGRVATGRYRSASEVFRAALRLLEAAETGPQDGEGGANGHVGLADRLLRESEARLRTLADAVPALVWSFDNDGNNLSFNARWFEFTGQAPEDAKGQGWADCLHPDDAATILPLWERCRRSGEPYLGECRYRRVDGAWRWHAFRGLPLRDTAGRITAWYGCSIDIHDLKTAEESLRQSEARLRLSTEGAGVGTWKVDLVAGQGEWSLEAAALLRIGRTENTLADWVEAIHPEDRDAAAEAWRRAVEDGALYEIEIRSAFPDQDGGERWLLSRGRVERDPVTGRPLRGAGVVLDITVRKRAERHRELLLLELNHRVKNTLATVQSIAVHNLREGCEPEVRRTFQSRLIALASAHDVLTAENWEAASLDDIVLQALRPHIDNGSAERIRLDGPEVRLTPKAALAFALVLHELATNAAKYGALSSKAGRVDVTWRLEDRSLLLTWRESGGPPVSPPERRGFGSRMIEAGFSHDLGGTFRLDFSPEGLVCQATLPLQKIVTRLVA